MGRVSVTHEGRQAIAKLHGDFVFDLNREFRDAYKELPSSTEFTIDFAQTNYMDSAGLGMLIRLREFAGKENARIRLTGINDTIRTILKVANFGRLFRID
jgi:anti-anti-sigma factor